MEIIRLVTHLEPKHVYGIFGILVLILGLLMGSTIFHEKLDHEHFTYVKYSKTSDKVELISKESPDVWYSSVFTRIVAYQNAVTCTDKLNETNAKSLD